MSETNMNSQAQVGGPPGPPANSASAQGPRREHLGITRLCFIVAEGQGSKLIHRLIELGARGATVCLALGTVANRWLDLLGITSERKEVVYSVMPRDLATATLDTIAKERRFDKANHGIGFSINLLTLVGANSWNETNTQPPTEGQTMFQCITTIVDRGRAEDVVQAANEAGGRGGTIFNARGSGIHETQTLLGMHIEPEKEVVMVLAPQAVARPIVNNIHEKLQLDQPGNGIIYVQPVAEVRGIYTE